MGVAFKHTVITKGSQVAYAVLDSHIIWEGVGNDLLAPTAYQADEISWLDALGYSADGIAVHLDPAGVVHVPGNVEEFFGMVIAAKDLLLLFFGDSGNKFGYSGLIVFAGIEYDFMPKVGHHVAEFAYFLRVGAVGVLGGRLCVGQVNHMEGKFF